MLPHLYGMDPPAERARKMEEDLHRQSHLQQTREEITPCPQKGTKKTYENFFIAFELQGEQNTMLSSKAIKQIS
jgi:hypothetical protein